MADVDFSNPTARERAIMAQGILQGLQEAHRIAFRDGGPVIVGAIARAIYAAQRQRDAAIREDVETAPQPGGTHE